MLDDPIDRQAFEVYVEQIPAPDLSAGGVGVMDNLSSHRGSRAQEMIQAEGARLLFLAPNSPDFDPIEKVFSKLKARLRKAAERIVERLWTTIGNLLDAFTPAECANAFAAAGYDAT